MKVLKFGGSSVATSERIRAVADILKRYYEKGEKFTVVFSAFGGVTDSLIEMGRLAAKGDDGYREKFAEFSLRHFETVEALFDKEQLEAVQPGLEKNHQVLRNLLHGIFLVREASMRTMDYVLSFGERNSAYIITKFLQQKGLPAAYLDARKIIKTDKNFGNAKVVFDLTYEKIREYFSQHPEVQVVGVDRLAAGQVELPGRAPRHARLRHGPP